MTAPPDPRQLLAAYRAAIEPDPSALEELWKDVADPDAELRVVQVESRRHADSVRFGWLGVAIGVAAAAAFAWWLGSLDLLGPTVSQPASTQAAYQHQSPATERRLPAPEPPPASLDAPSAAPLVDPPPAGERPPARAPSRTRPKPAALDPLAAETRLIAQAESALRRSDPAAALDILARHATAHPHGALAIERQALRVIALCTLGNTMQGRGEASVLRGRVGAHPYAERIQRACENSSE